MISLPRSPVIDRLCWVCIGTRWIRYSENRRGTAKRTSPWKIKVKGKLKKKKKAKGPVANERNNYGPVVSCPCLPCCKKQKKSIMNRGGGGIFVALFSSKPGARWRNAHLSWRQPNRKQAGVQKPCPLLPTGGPSASVLLLYLSFSPRPPLSLRNQLLPKDTFLFMCMSVYVGGGAFLHVSIWGTVIFSEY